MGNMRILTMGSATVDVFAHTDRSQMIEIKGMKDEEDFIAYPSGTKILLKKIAFTVGGGGTNTAVSFSRMGIKASFLGKLGDDENADLVMKALKREGVVFRGARGRGSTGFSIILDSIAHDRTILAFKGVNDSLKRADIKRDAFNYPYYYLSSMVGESLKTQMGFVKEVKKKRDALIMYNPSSYIAEKGLKTLGAMLSNIDILCLNLEEAKLLSGESSLSSAIKTLGSIVPLVIVTNGGRAVYAGVFSPVRGVDVGEQGFFRAYPRKVRVVEATGAGDAFASGFLSALIHGKDVAGAISVGVVNAESVIQYHGAKNKLLSWRSALAALRKHPVVVERRASL